jgi:outer membrane immunogenic protein
MRGVVAVLFGATLSFASAQSASAGNLPTKATPHASSLPYNWTGFYVGGQAGGGWDSNQVIVVNSTVHFPAGYPHAASHGSGFLAGGYVGLNYQVNQFVVGIESDFSWANLIGSEADPSPLTGVVNHDTEQVRWIATLTGRLGYAVDNWMFFGKGGAAMARFNGNGNIPTVATNTSTTTREGWTVGTGIEWGFAVHWSAKLEYDYVDFGTANYTRTTTSGSSPPTIPFRAISSLNLAKLGLAYRF